MKKSKLRNIIRESIKELITEQINCPNGSNVTNVAGLNDPCYSNNSCYGLTSTFINNMNNGFNNANANPTQQNNGCEWLDNKREAKQNAWMGLQQTSGQAFCVGENPNWQARLFNQRRWIKNKLQAETAAGSCPGW